MQTKLADVQSAEEIAFWGMGKSHTHFLQRITTNYHELSHYFVVIRGDSLLLIQNSGGCNRSIFGGWGCALQNGRLSPIRTVHITIENAPKLFKLMPFSVAKPNKLFNLAFFSIEKRIRLFKLSCFSMENHIKLFNLAIFSIEKGIRLFNLPPFSIEKLSLKQPVYSCKSGLFPPALKLFYALVYCFR